MDAEQSFALLALVAEVAALWWVIGYLRRGS